MRAGRRLYDSIWFLRCCEAAIPLGFIAVLAGWTTTEVGRQPWTVYGVMRTADSVSPSLSGQDVLISLVCYGIVYLIIFPVGFAVNRVWRNLIMNSIAPIWDGNETWLVLGGVGLFAAFPLAFAVIMPAVYFPILGMLLALAFRGVAFEFRYRDAPHRTFWDYAFCLGSAVATFAQGIVLGAFIQGFEVTGRNFAGTSFDCVTPISIWT